MHVAQQTCIEFLWCTVRHHPIQNFARRFPLRNVSTFMFYDRYQDWCTLHGKIRVGNGAKGMESVHFIPEAFVRPTSQCTGHHALILKHYDKYGHPFNIFRWSIRWFVPTLSQKNKCDLSKCLGADRKCCGQWNVAFPWAIIGGVYDPLSTLAALYWNLVWSIYWSLLRQPSMNLPSNL